MDVWDESVDRRSEFPRRSRIRRFRDWKDYAVFFAEISGVATVAGGFIMLLLSSLGFSVSGAGQAIAQIQSANVVRDTAIARLQRQTESSSSRLDAVTYLVCEKAKHDDPSMILPIECSRVKPQ
jgi:hypothetical protein